MSHLKDPTNLNGFWAGWLTRHQKMPPEGNPEGLQVALIAYKVKWHVWFAVYLLTMKLRLKTIRKNVLQCDAIKLLIAIMELVLVILRSNTE